MKIYYQSYYTPLLKGEQFNKHDTDTHTQNLMNMPLINYMKIYYQSYYTPLLKGEQFNKHDNMPLFVKYAQ